MNKHFELSQEDMNVILKVKQEQNFRSEKKALQYIIKKYQEQEETEHLLLNIYEKIQEQRKHMKIELNGLRQWQSKTRLFY